MDTDFVRCSASINSVSKAVRQYLSDRSYGYLRNLLSLGSIDFRSPANVFQDIAFSFIEQIINITPKWWSTMKAAGCMI